MAEHPNETAVQLPGSIHRPPRARIVDRVEFITNLVSGKTVIDLGFVDESRMRSKQALGTWLHALIARAAASAVGIDTDREGVALAQELGYEGHLANCESGEELAGLGLQPADVVVAGELIEHLDQPGRFLEAVKVLVKPTGALVLTTPNAPSMTNFVASLLHRELVNPDHVSWFSWHTLRTLLGRHGWTITDVAYYGFPRVPTPDGKARDRAQARLFNSYQSVARPLFRLRPTLADGVIVVASLDG